MRDAFIDEFLKPKRRKKSFKLETNLNIRETFAFFKRNFQLLFSFTVQIQLDTNGKTLSFSYDCSWHLWISSSFRKEKIIHIVNAIIQNESSALRKSTLLKVKHCKKINKVAYEKIPALVR